MQKLDVTIISSQATKEVSVSETDTIGQIIKQYLPAESNAPDTMEDLECHLNDSHEELPKDKELHHLKIKKGDKLIFSRCRKVEVLIKHGGHEFRKSYPPNVKLAKAKDDACHEWHITGQEKIDLLLYDEVTGALVSVGSYLAFLSTYPHCCINLELCKDKSIQG